jgi:hypothetical protein
MQIRMAHSCRALALADVAGLVNEINRLLGTSCSGQDRAAGVGWVLYRLIELLSQRRAPDGYAQTAALHWSPLTI